MKKIILTLVFTAGLFSAQAQRLKGSDTVLPVSQKLAERYMKTKPGTSITVTGGGSGVGLAALREQTTDIAQSSRRIKFDERTKLKEKGQTIKEVIIGYDALAVVVHPENKVDKLTREQLEGIFTGKIQNWKDLGGADLKIVPYARETSSGTYVFFKEAVMKNKNYLNGILSMPATGAIIQSVSQTKGAIGYVGIPYLNKKVKAVHLSFDSGKTYTAPSVATGKDKSYPVVRPLYYYYTVKNEAMVKPFIDFTLSAAGQKIVLEDGLITVL